MKPKQLLLILLLAGLITPSINAELKAADLQQMALVSNKSILVTFVDRTITRRPIASLSGSYRRSGSYKSSTWSRNIAASLAENYNLRNLSEWPITELGVQCVVYEITDDRSVDDVVKILANDDRVEAVQRMVIFDMHAVISNQDPYFKLQTNLHDLQLEDAHRLATGKNVQIALIDTGVDFHHPDLEGQIVPANNFTADISKGFSGDIHGTAMAGVIAAQANNGIGIVGVAPDAQVISIKACWPRKQDKFKATCNSFTLALAINRAIKMGADIINLSLGGPPDPLVGRLIDAAIAKGTIVIAADPGTDRDLQRFPASMENVIAAHSTQQPSDNEESSNFSHFITAPGTNVLTTIPQATYDFMSGCSLAAAHVTGIVALLLEINPDLTAREISKLLETTKKKQSSKHAGEINTLAAISRLRTILP